MSNYRNRVFKIIFSLVIVWAIAWASVWFGNWIQATPAIMKWDQVIYEWFQGLPRNPIAEAIVWPVNFDFLSWSGSKPSFIYFLVGGFVIAIIARKREKFWQAMAALALASVFIVWATNLDWTYVHRKRPFLVLPSQVDSFSWNSWKDWSTYPSGHVRETTLYSTIIASFFPGARLSLGLFVAFVGLSRLYLGAHYLTDVLAAMALAWTVAQGALGIVRAIAKEDSYSEPGRPKQVPSQDIAWPVMPDIDARRADKGNKDKGTSQRKQSKQRRLGLKSEKPHEAKDHGV